MNRIVAGGAAALTLGVAVAASAQNSSQGGAQGAGQGNAQGASQNAGQNSAQNAGPNNPQNAAQNNAPNNPQDRGTAADWTYGGFNQDPWFGQADVRDQLRLNGDQYSQLQSRYSQAWNRYRQGVDQLPGNLSESQRMARRQQLQQSFANDFSRARQDVLTDPTQRRRFDQLSLQYQGPGALNDPTVQRRLQFSQEQRQQLEQVQQQWRQWFDQNRLQGDDGSGLNRNLADRWTQFQDQTNASLNRIFTPNQRQLWNEMRGENFAFPQTSYYPSDPSRVGRSGREAGGLEQSPR